MTNPAVVARLDRSVRRHAQIPADVGQRLGNTSDLPDVLKAMLRYRNRPDGPDAQILDVMRHLEGVCTIDEVMVHLYRKHGVLTQNRRELAQRMYRLVQRKKIQSVPGRRGVFALLDA